MNTLVVEKKRKNIDIPIDVFKNLSVKAAYKGVTLKVFIENLLSQIASDIEDEELYLKFSRTKPEGNVYLNEEEQNNFEQWLER